jgi:peptide deformylase
MILPIVQYGAPVLRRKGLEVSEITDEIRQFAADMIETMRAADGVGLAAQQVGRALQLAVVEVPQESESRPSRMWQNGEEVQIADWMPMVLINPSLKLGTEKATDTEGCLSFPKITGSVTRPATVKVSALDLEGRMLEFEADGLLARAVQHEYDHLQGILFIDRMNSATKVVVARKLKALRRD